MLNRLSFLIGLRYVRAKKKNHFISFISAISVLGIALGVTVLITVLSIVNGFEQEIKTRLLMLMPHMTLTNWQGDFHHSEQWIPTLKAVSRVQGVAPYIQIQAMLGSLDQPAFAVIKGIDPILEPTVSPIAQQLYSGQLTDLKPGDFGLIIGKDLASRLNIDIGDSVTVFVPKTTASIMGIVPRIKNFTIVGLFDTGFEYDARYALMHIQDASTLLRLGKSVTGLQISIDNPFETDSVAEHILPLLSKSLLLTDWKRQNQNLFSALQMMKSSLFLVLLLMIGVAAFNMLASLVMLVTDKQSDIAILATMGTPSSSIMGIFVIQGMVIGCIGAMIGALGGILLSEHLSVVVASIEALLHIQLLPKGVYLINFLPSKLLYSDVGLVCIVALLLSLLATLYPAYRASCIDPVEALRYE